jgi:hypothetical protein
MMLLDSLQLVLAHELLDNTLQDLIDFLSLLHILNILGQLLQFLLEIFEAIIALVVEKGLEAVLVIVLLDKALQRVVDR